MVIYYILKLLEYVTKDRIATHTIIVLNLKWLNSLVIKRLWHNYIHCIINHLKTVVCYPSQPLLMCTMPIYTTPTSITKALLSCSLHTGNKVKAMANVVHRLVSQGWFLRCTLIVTQHEKTMLMYTNYTSIHYFNYLTFCVSYTSSVNCIEFPIVSCTISKSIINTLCLVSLDKKLLKFKD